MNFNAPLLKPIRILLFPFSLLYALVVRSRNIMYDKGWLSTATFRFPLICVGNLAVGGTGKSTLVEFLVGHLREQFNVAILSRGYKRKTKGYALAHAGSTALEVGDEPMQFLTKFPDVTIAVGEERLVAIPQLLHDKPLTDVIILDDAFQHRSIRAGYTIVLTEWNNLYIHDWYLPTGDLRDAPARMREADVVLVTKCPPALTTLQARTLANKFSLAPHQKLYFSSIRYGIPYHMISQTPRKLDSQLEVLLVSGIANPLPLKQYLHEQTQTYYEMLFGDHHIFTIDDWRDVTRRFTSMASPHKIILTTEKDAVRLFKFGKELEPYPVYVIPIEMELLFGEEDGFIQSVVAYIEWQRRQQQAAYGQETKEERV